MISDHLLVKMAQPPHFLFSIPTPAEGRGEPQDRKTATKSGKKLYITPVQPVTKL